MDIPQPKQLSAFCGYSAAVKFDDVAQHLRRRRHLLSKLDIHLGVNVAPTGARFPRITNFPSARIVLVVRGVFIWPMFIHRLTHDWT